MALGIGDPMSLVEAYDTVVGNAVRVSSSAPQRVLVEKMTVGLAELVVGNKHDETFGPVVVVGLGGIWVEVMCDYALCLLCPVATAEARDAIEELRGLPPLSGGRGGPACDLDALARMVSAVSQLAMERPDLVEIDRLHTADSDGAIPRGCWRTAVTVRMDAYVSHVNQITALVCQPMTDIDRRLSMATMMDWTGFSMK